MGKACQQGRRCWFVAESCWWMFCRSDMSLEWVVVKEVLRMFPPKSTDEGTQWKETFSKTIARKVLGSCCLLCRKMEPVKESICKSYNGVSVFSRMIDVSSMMERKELENLSVNGPETFFPFVFKKKDGVFFIVRHFFQLRQEET